MNNELVNCNWCANELVHRDAVKYDGELIGKRCQPYAWAAIVNPGTYEANRAIAVRRFATNYQKLSANTSHNFPILPT